jgi:hypothetical protein
MNELPRFMAAAADAGVLTSGQLADARDLVARTANAAWASRSQPPFLTTDVCNEFAHTQLPSGDFPKFSWDFSTASGLTCMDARTQVAALATFVADDRIQAIASFR